MTRGYAAPQLPGYTFVDLIGQGGFADVFRYTQHRPSRDVAIKVLTAAGLRGEAREQFEAEAELMAQLATHPSIVSIYATDLSADGRPYLVMEYCSGPSLARRARTEQVPVPEVLDTAVQVCAAVETAHRAGILHRDVKPHNILTNAYGHPQLTDFGIAVVRGRGGNTSGVSIPWAPPELLGDQTSEDVRSDVYSLAATVYTLVAGRSPHEVKGGANDAHTMISRIERTPVPRLLRADVSERLQEVLQRGMAKDPADRPASAMSLARALQEVQIDMHLSPTKIDVLDASPSAAPHGEDDERTRVRPIKVIDPYGPTDPDGADGQTAVGAAQHTGRPTTPMPLGHGGPRGPEFTGPDRPDEVDHTQRRTPTPSQVAGARRAAAAPPDPTQGLSSNDSDRSPSVAPPAEPPGRRSHPALVGVAALVLLLGGVVAVGLAARTPDQHRPARTALGTDHDDQDAVGNAVPEVTDLRGILRGTAVRVTWTDPDPRPGDSFKIQVDARKPEPGTTPFTFAYKAKSPNCFRVWLVRKNGTFSDPAFGCPRAAT